MRTLTRFTTRISVLALAALPSVAQAALINPASDRPSDIPSATDIRQTTVRILNYVLSFVGLIAVGFLIYAGFLYLFSGGKEDTVKKAKTIIWDSVIGIIIILLSWVIVNTVIAQVSGTISSGNPGTGT